MDSYSKVLWKMSSLYSIHRVLKESKFVYLRERVYVRTDWSRMVKDEQFG